MCWSKGVVFIGVLFVSGVAFAGDVPGDGPDDRQVHKSDESADSAAEGSPAVTIIKPEDGEKYSFRDGRHVLLKVSKETGAAELFMGQETLPEGTVIPVHSHDGYEEIIFIHAGDAVVRLGDEEIPVEAGTTVFIPPGAWHAIGQHGDEDTKMLFIFPETEMAEFFRAVGKPEGGEPPVLTPEDFMEIMKKHQMRSYPEEVNE